MTRATAEAASQEIYVLSRIARDDNTFARSFRALFELHSVRRMGYPLRPPHAIGLDQ